jgi:hypothetical protein
MENIFTAGMGGNFFVRFSMYKCPTTIITAANTMTRVAFVDTLRSFRPPPSNSRERYFALQKWKIGWKGPAGLPARDFHSPPRQLSSRRGDNNPRHLQRLRRERPKVTVLAHYSPQLAPIGTTYPIATCSRNSLWLCINCQRIRRQSAVSHHRQRPSLACPLAHGAAAGRVGRGLPRRALPCGQRTGVCALVLKLPTSSYLPFGPAFRLTLALAGQAVMRASCRAPAAMWPADAAPGAAGRPVRNWGE